MMGLLVVRLGDQRGKRVGHGGNDFCQVLCADLGLRIGRVFGESLHPPARQDVLRCIGVIVPRWVE